MCQMCKMMVMSALACTCRLCGLCALAKPALATSGHGTAGLLPPDVLIPDLHRFEGVATYQEVALQLLGADDGTSIEHENPPDSFFLRENRSHRKRKRQVEPMPDTRQADVRNRVSNTPSAVRANDSPAAHVRSIQQSDDVEAHSAHDDHNELDHDDGHHDHEGHDNHEGHDDHEGHDNHEEHDDHGAHEAIDFGTHLANEGHGANAVLLSELQDAATKQLSQARLEEWLQSSSSNGEAGHDEHGHDEHGHDEHGHGAHEDEGDVEFSLTVAGLMSRYGGVKLTEKAVGMLASEVAACEVSPSCHVVAHTEEPPADPSGLDTITGYKLNWLKVGVAGFLLLEKVVGTLLPLLFVGHARFNQILSFLHSFSAGIFLSIGLVFLLPHAQHAEENIDYDYQLAPVIAVAGYLFIYFIERIMPRVSTTAAHLPDSHNHGPVAVQDTAKGMGMLQGALPDDANGESEVTVDLANQQLAGGGNQPGEISVPVPPVHATGVATAVTKPEPKARVDMYPLIVFLTSLGIHQILEAIVVGVLNDARDVLLLFAALALHKLPVHVALSVRFLGAGCTVKQLLKWLLPFSLVAPASILLGMALSEGASPEAELVVHGLSAGVILYLGTSELMCGEGDVCSVSEHSGARGAQIRQLLAVVAGALFVVPAVFIPGGHGHDH